MKRGVFLLVLMLVGAFLMADVIISEIADPKDETGARFIELYNTGSSSVDIGDWKIVIYYNGNTNPGATVTIPSGTTLESGKCYVIANGSKFDSYYNTTANQYSGSINSNGDDTHVLEDASGTMIDIYGEIGVDGTGKAWEFSDRVAYRNSSVNHANTTWTSSEWTIVSENGAQNGTPGTHTCSINTWMFE